MNTYVLLAAGALSSIDPAVLPALVGFVVLVILDRRSPGAAGEPRLVDFLPSFRPLIYLFSFLLVFLGLGLPATWPGRLIWIEQNALRWLGGAAAIWSALIYLSGRSHGKLTPGRERIVIWPAALLMGAAAAAGWLVKPGPTLTQVVLFASTPEHWDSGLAMIGAYTLGLGMMFFLSGMTLASGWDLISGGVDKKRAALWILLFWGVLMVAGGLDRFLDWGGPIIKI